MLEPCEALGVRLQQRQIVTRAGQAEQRQRAVGLPLAEFVERRGGACKLAVERGAVQSRLAHLAFERVVDHVAVEHAKLIPESDNYGMGETPTGLPTTTVVSVSSRKRRRATLRTSSSLTAAISAPRRVR